MKCTKRMDFSPELVWKSGQSAAFMSKLDKNVKDVEIQKFSDECDIVYWRINLPPGIANRDFCVMRLLRARPEIQSFETLLISAVHPNFPEKKGSTRAFLFAYSNVQAAPGAPLDANGVPTAATNMSLGFTDVRGSIPPKLMEKMMCVLDPKPGPSVLTHAGVMRLMQHRWLTHYTGWLLHCRITLSDKQAQTTINTLAAAKREGLLS
jgi:hypothetical protein